MYQTGAIKNTQDNRDIQYSQVATPTVLPSKHITNIEHLPVFNQGQLGTCVAHCIALVKMYQEWKETGKIINFSRRYLYSKARKMSIYEQDAMGLRPRDCAKILCDHGDEDGEDNDNNGLNHTDYVNYINTIDYKKYKSTYTTATDLNSIKQAIIKEGLVTVSLSYDNNAWNHTTGDIVKPVHTTSAHYVTIYGYEDINGDTVLFFRNSWGIGWGNNGNGRFWWSDYRTNASDFLIFTDVPNNLVEEARAKSFIFSINLKYGMKHPDVAKLQERLRKESFFKRPTNTGNFGEVTKQAVVNYQKSKNLQADGIVGKKTREELNK